jgi:predicted ATPase
MATKGYSAPEVASNFIRARELCQKIGEMPQLFPILRGLRLYYSVRGEHRTGRQLGEQMLTLARNLQDRSLLLEAHVGLESPLFWSGELALARKHAEQGIALYDSQKHRSHAVLYGQDPGASCLLYAALALSHLGYPDLASKRAEEALALAQELTHPFSLAFTLFSAATVYSFCRQEQAVYETAQAVIALSTEQGFPMALTIGTYFQGWSLAKQGQREQGIADMQHSLAALQTMGSMLTRSFMLALLAETYGAGGEAEKGLAVLTEAFAVVAETGEHNYEAELYRLKGELLLNGERRTMNDERRTCKADARHTAKAEACFQQAIEIAQSRSPVAAARQDDRSKRTSRTGLRLVHRRL